MRVIRPSVMWRIANGVGAMVFLVGGTWWLLSTAASDVGAALLGIPAIAFGGLWLVRIFHVRASFDHDTLYLRNLFRNVEIPRGQITEVDTDPRSAQVWWTTATGRTRFAAVVAASVGPRYPFPLSALSREQAFLRAVERWAKRRRA
jgi:hypothetical protein